MAIRSRNPLDATTRKPDTDGGRMFQITKRDPKERALVHQQFDKIQQMIHLKAHARDINHELDVLSRLTRIRRQRGRSVCP